MRKKLSFTLLFAAILWLGLSMISCVKENNNNDEGTPTEESEELTPEETFWKVVGQLVDRNERTSDYKNKTFMPTIGDPDNGDESIRIVLVNDLGAAAGRYNMLVGANIDETTATHTYNNPEVGQLTWTKSNDNKAWGTVDVDIQQVPSLRKIIYRSPEQGDANGSVGDGGSAYYRFGDVIQRTRSDNKTEYWICVRPAFDKDGKGKSHWVSVSPLPMSNVWPYNETEKPKVCSNGFEYGMPYNLGDDLEWTQDLAEMLFAILHPHEWATNLQNHYKETAGVKTGLRMFNDMDYDDYGKYHNEDFWKNVQKQWKEKGLFPKLFGVSYDEMSAALDPNGTGRGLHLLYNGYSWNTVTSNKPKLYQVHYANSTTEGKKMNMHLQTKKTIQSQVVDPKKTVVSNINYPMDVYKLTEGTPYLKESRFFSDEYPRWIVRYAEGVELAENGKWNPQLSISGFEGIGEVYRYYYDVFSSKNLTDGPEITGGTGDKANYHGYFYPCCMVRDNEGSTWLCYDGWYDIDGLKGGEYHYSRFVSFDVHTSSEEGGVFFSDGDLIPENELPYAALQMLTTYFDIDKTSDGNQDRYKTVRQKILEYSNIDIGLTLVRDTLWHYSGNNKEVDVRGYIDALNFVYTPQSGRLKGTQPYMRYVQDGSRCGPERSQIGSLYPYEHFYKYYNVPLGHTLRGKAMDLTHLFTSSDVLASGVPADKWSKCARRSGSQRDGAFSASNRYSGSFNAGLFKSNPSQYVSAYHEPVIAMRFMKVEDTRRDQMPTTSVNNLHLTELYRPVTDESYILNFLLTTNNKMATAGKDGYCYMDEIPYIVALPN